jgi:chemotaxis protein MotB
MAFGEESGPVIIQKKKKAHGGHHGGAWKVAYADFVTAMMALFIVLWILGQSEEVKKSVSEYFQDPVGFGDKIQKGKGGIIPTQGNGIIDLNLKARLERQQREKEELSEMSKAIEKEISGNPEFQDLTNQISIEFVQEGLKIELMESMQYVFFDIGSSQLNQKASDILKKIGAQIATMNYNVIIEGHTDSRQYSGGPLGYTNYELSSERANSARRALVSGGLKEKQIDHVRGCADKKLKNVKDPFDVVNRRISIIVKYSD